MAGGGKADDSLLLLGEIGAAVGLRGELRLRSYTEDPAAIAGYGPLATDRPGQSLTIQNLRPGPKMLVAKFKGVNDRSAAEALTGTRLYIDRERLPESGADEWYYADLIGLAAIDGTGAPLGTVVAVHNFGAGDLIELAPESGATMLIPFTEKAVPDVNVADGRLTVTLPEELATEDGRTEEREASDEALPPPSPLPASERGPGDGEPGDER